MIFDIFLIFAQNIDCGYMYLLELPQSGLIAHAQLPNEYTQSMFKSKDKKNNVYRCEPNFDNIKVGCKGFLFT